MSDETVLTSAEQSGKAEAAFLAHVLAGELVAEYAEKLEPSDFAEIRNNMIWSAMLALHDANKAVTSVAIEEHLRENHALDVVTPEYLKKVVMLAAQSSGGDTAALAQSAFEIVRDRSVRRRALDFAQKITAVAGEYDAGVTLEFMQEVLDNIQEKHANGKKQTEFAGQELVTRYAEILRRRADGSAPRSYILPWAAFAAPTVGVIPAGKVIVVAAGTGVGKSIFAEQMAEHAARMGQHALYISAEMNEEDYLDRSVARWTGIPTSTLRGENAQAHQAAIEAFKIASASWLDGFTYSFLPSASARDVYNRLKRAIDNGYTFFVIDHITALSYIAKRGETIKQAMDNFVRAVHDLAVERGVIVVLVSQVTQTEFGARTYGSTIAEHVAALYIMLETHTEKESHKYTLQRGGTGKSALVTFHVKEGDRSPMVTTFIKKNRVSGYNGRVELALYGLRYYDVDAITSMYLSPEQVEEMEKHRRERAAEAIENMSVEELVNA